MAQFNSYPDVVSLESGDELVVYQNNQVKNATVDQLKNAVSDASRWVLVDPSKYTSAPSGPLKVDMSDTTDIFPGDPVRFTQGGVFTYGIVNVVTPSTSIEILGWNLNGISITEMAIGKAEMIFEIVFNVEGGYGSTIRQDLLAGIMKTGYRWRGKAGHLVQVSAYNSQADTTLAPVVNVLLNGSRTIQDGTDPKFGIAVTGNGVWNNSNFINSATGTISRNQDIELEITGAGTAGDALNLTAHLIFLLD